MSQSDLEVILKYVPAPGNVACFGACKYTVSFNQGAVDYWTLQQGDNVGLQVGFGLTAVVVTITRSGLGTGTVVANGYSPPAGKAPTSISCGSQCTGEFDYGRPLTLTATPDAEASFTQWTGACAGQGPTCTVKATATTSTNAVVGLASQTTTTTTKTTTTAHTTTTTQATSTTATTASPAAGHQLAAQLIGTKSGKSKLGFRVENVEVRASETIHAALLLSRKGTNLAHTLIPRITIGDRVLTLPIPSAVKKGKATVTVTLSDSAGNHHSWTRTVAIPS
jgi:hypothetical protein